jgi:hypothetical protein
LDGGAGPLLVRLSMGLFGGFFGDVRGHPHFGAQLLARLRPNLSQNVGLLIQSLPRELWAAAAKKFGVLSFIVWSTDKK